MGSSGIEQTDMKWLYMKIEGKRLKNKIFQSRDLCLRALDTNSACAKSVRRNEDKNGSARCQPPIPFI